MDTEPWSPMLNTLVEVSIVYTSYIFIDADRTIMKVSESQRNPILWVRCVYLLRVAEKPDDLLDVLQEQGRRAQIHTSLDQPT